MKNTIYIKTIQKRIFINLSIFILTLCTTLPLSAQEWQWLQHAGCPIDECTEGGNPADDEVIDFFVDSVGNSYLLIQFPYTMDAILFGDTIEHKHKVKNSLICYSLASLSPNGELRWYKTLYGTCTAHSNDTVYETTATVPIPKMLRGGTEITFDGTHIICVATSSHRIRLTDGEGGDTLLPVHPLNPQLAGQPSNNFMTRDVILKIDLEGNIVWQNSISEMYPVPVSDTIYYGTITIANVFVDENKNIDIICRLTVPNNRATTLPIQANYDNYIIKLTPEGELIETVPSDCEVGTFCHFQNGHYYQIGTVPMDYYTIGGRHLWELCDTTGFNPTHPFVNTGPSIFARFSENGEFEWIKLLDTMHYNYSVKQNLTQNNLQGDHFLIVDSWNKHFLKMDLDGNVVDTIPTHIPQFGVYDNGVFYHLSGFPASDHDFLNEETLVLGGGNRRDTLSLSDHLSIPDAWGPAIALFHIPTETFLAGYCGQTYKHTTCIPQTAPFTRISVDLKEKNIYGAGLFNSYSQTFGEYTIYNYDPSTYDRPETADIFVTKLGWSEGEEGTWPDSPPVTVTEANVPIELNLYPNPAQSSFNLVSENNPIGKIEVYNLTGQRVIDLPGFGFTQAAINIAHLPAGLYVVKIETRKGWVEKKLVVE